MRKAIAMAGLAAMAAASVMSEPIAINNTRAGFDYGYTPGPHGGKYRNNTAARAHQSKLQTRRRRARNKQARRMRAKNRK